MDNLKGKYIPMALSISVQMILFSSVSMIDIYMVSALGAISISALYIASSLALICFHFLYGVGSGLSVIVSRYNGANQYQTVRSAVYSSILISFAFTALFSLVAYCFSSEIFGIVSSDKELTKCATDYITLLIPALILSSLTLVCDVYLNAIGKFKVALCVSSIGVVTNILLNIALIPDYGVKGVAMASSISRMCECLVLIYLLRDIFKMSRIAEFGFHSLSETSKVCLPLAANAIILALGMHVYNSILSSSGTIEGASLALLSTIGLFISSVSWGIASSMGISVGNFIGSETFIGNKLRIKKYSTYSLIFLLCMCLLFSVSVDSVLMTISDYGDDVISMVNEVSLIYFSYLFFNSANAFVMCGFLKPGGMIKFSVWCDIFCQWLIGIPMIVILQWYDCEFYLLLLPLVVEQVIKLIIGSRVLSTGDWVRNINVGRASCDN